MNDSQFCDLDHLAKVRKKLYAHRGVETEVGVRLDIPSSQRGLEVVTIHESPAGGQVIGYDHSCTISNARFIVHKAGAEAVASGGHKYPFAYIGGELSPEPAAPNGRLVYYNPRKTHLFIDAETHWAVKSAEIVYQIGRRTYAIGLKYYKPREMPEAPEDFNSIARPRR